MKFFTLSVLSVLAAQAAAVPHPVKHIVHERRDALPKSWIKRDRLDANVELPVRIGMTQSNLDRGHELLMEV